MAEEREPPLLENEPDLFDNDDDDDDIFKSATGPPKLDVSSEPAAEVEVDLFGETATEPKTGDGDHAAKPEPEPLSEPFSPQKDTEAETKSQDTDDLFSGNATSKDPSSTDVDMSTAEDEQLTDGDDLFASPSSDLPVKRENVPAPVPDFGKDSAASKSSSQDELEAAEEQDKFNVEISVNNPTKVGDGMNAYMVYQVNTVTNLPAFGKSQFSVKRRFSDFLGLHDKLVAKHRANGIVVPKPPEKSTMGMAKVKMSKEESGSHDFVEKRRAALERYMNRTVAHTTLRMDPDVRDYLTMDSDLPKASGTSALSAAGVMRLFGKVGDAVTKLSTSLTETDLWFEDKIVLIESQEVQIRKLHESSETLVARRHTSSNNNTMLAKALAVVASCDEHTNLSQVMSKLAEVEDNLQQITEEQADSDFFTFSELLKDYLSQISAVKEVFAERIKIHKVWKDAELTLTKKREAKVKLELANKTEKIQNAQNECKEWEERVEKGEKDFKKISDALKKEMACFDRKRCKDFKANMINYLERLLNNEEQLIKYWEAFLPEARSIA